MANRRLGDDVMSHYYSSYVSTLPWQYQHPRSIRYSMNRSAYTCPKRRGRNSSCASDEEALFTDNALVAWKGTQREFGRGILHLLKSIDISSNKLYGKLPFEITNLLELVSLNFSDNRLHGEVPKHMGRLRSLDSLDLSRNEFSGNIPSSLSQLTRLSYLNLSYNNFSGRIPTGTQLQSFNYTSYTGNPQLCGLPLTQRCGLPSPPPPATVVGKEDRDEFWKSYYTGMGGGFAVGFLGLCGALFLNHRCRYLFFASLSNMKDRIYVTTVVHFRSLQRKFRQ
ncbi:putative transferase [Helianthus debilis subsp. tardiflorus]